MPLAVSTSMSNRSTPHLPVTSRDLGRDRSVLALAAALCGALAAAGIAAVAVGSQITPRQGEEALSETRTALYAATQELERSRHMLQETRSELAEVRAAQASTPPARPAAPSTPSCRHRPQPLQARTIPTAHVLRTTGPNTTTVMSTFRVTTSTLPTPHPAANPALRCDEGHRCTVRRDFLEAALFGVDGPRSRARVAAMMLDGSVLGMKVYNVRHGDPAEVLGFRNRDTIVAINGQAWRDKKMSAMLRYIQELRAETPDALTITIDRNGEEIDKHFDLL